MDEERVFPEWLKKSRYREPLFERYKEEVRISLERLPEDIEWNGGVARSYEEMLRIKKWTQSDLKTIRESILEMIDENIKPLCAVIDEYSLSKLKGNNVVHHNESSLVQCFIDAISYSFLNQENIEREYKVNEHSRDHGTRNRAIDVVFKLHPKTKIGIEFKNIPIKELKQWINDETPSKDWEKQFKQSESLFHYPEDDVLELPLIDSHEKGNTTVQKALDNAIEQANSYKKDLSSNFDGKVIVFVIVRVGLRKLIIRKL